MSFRLHQNCEISWARKVSSTLIGIWLIFLPVAAFLFSWKGIYKVVGSLSLCLSLVINIYLHYTLDEFDEIICWTSRVSVSKEKRRRRTNFLGVERVSPVSPEKKSENYSEKKSDDKSEKKVVAFSLFTDLWGRLLAASPGCPVQSGLAGRGGGVQEGEGGNGGGTAATFKYISKSLDNRQGGHL